MTEQLRLLRWIDNKPAPFSSALLSFSPSIEEAVVWKNEKCKCRASIVILCILIRIQLLHFGFGHGTRQNSREAVWERHSSFTLSWNPRMKSHLAPCQNPQLKLHNTVWRVWKLSGVCVSPQPDKMEQRNRHSEGDFRFMLLLFPVMWYSSKGSSSPSLYFKSHFSLLPLLGLVYSSLCSQRFQQTQVDLTALFSCCIFFCLISAKVLKVKAMTLELHKNVAVFHSQTCPPA